MLYLSSFISAPTSPPAVSVSGGSFQVGHRRKNTIGLFTETQVITGVGFPCQVTLQPSIDPGKIQDEILVRHQNDSVWRKVPQNLIIGSQADLPASIPTSWDPVSVAQLADNQGSQETVGLDFGEFNSASEPSQTLFVSNNGTDTIESISINLRSPEGYLLDVLNDRLEISLQGVKGKYGAGVSDSTYNQVHIFSSQGLNTLPVMIPVGGALQITLKLVNFPAYGLQSTPIEAEFDITPNAGAVSVPPLSLWPDSGIHWDPQNDFQWVTKDPSSTGLLLNPYRIRVGSRIFNSDLRLPISTPGPDVFLVISGNGTVTLENQSGFVVPDGSLVVAKISLTVATGVISSYETMVPLSTSPYFLEPLGVLTDARFVKIGTTGLLELGGTTGVSVGTDGYFVGLGPAIVTTSVGVTAGAKLGSNAQGEAILDPEGSIIALIAGDSGTRILVWVGPQGGSGGSGGTQDPTNLGSSRTASQYSLTSSTGSGTNILEATGSLAGLLTASDKTKLNGIATGAQVNVPSNLTGTQGASDYTIGNSNGSGVTIPIVGALAGLMTPADKTKLNGIASGAQVNLPTDLSTSVGSGNILLLSSTGQSVTIPAATTLLSGLMTAADKVALNSSGATNLSVAQSGLGLEILSSSGTDVVLPKASALSGDQQGTVSRDDYNSWHSKQGSILTPGSGTQLISGPFMRSLVAGAGMGITLSGNDITLASTVSTAGLAPLASPTFTGTPAVPTAASVDIVTTQIPSSLWVAQRHAIGVCEYPGAALSIANNAWSAYTSAGTLSYALGGFTLGAGSAGLVAPRAGIYRLTARGVLNVPAAQGVRSIAGFVSGAAGFLIAHTIVNGNQPFLADTHFSVSMEITLAANTQIRPALYVDVTLTGPILYSVYALSMTRIG